jgi:2-phosphoglycerate kinase
MVGARRSWQVLLIGGNSGAGKSTIARELARHFELPLLPVDDLRLTLEWSTSTHDYPALHLFDDFVQVYRQPPGKIAEFRIAVAEATSRAIEIVVANHAANAGPIILEGDDLTPGFATQRSFTDLDVAPGTVRAVYVIESDESAIEANMRGRGRWFSQRSPIQQRNMVRVSALYGAWLRQEAMQRNLHVVAPRPYDTLLQRILALFE